MNKKEILESLAAINLDLTQAEQLIRRAGVHAHTTLRALHQEWKGELLDEQIANLPPAIAEASTALAPAPAAAKPAIDLNDPSLREVPQSKASRLPQIPEPAPTPTTPPTPAPTPSRPAKFEGPTVEAPVVNPAGPTPEPTAPDDQASVRARFQEQLGHFTGTGSLFSRHLSPQVIVSGKGFLRPGVSGLQQYSDDLLLLTPQRLEAWPTGFYRDRNTSEQQLLINSNHGIVIVPMLPLNDQIPMVVVKPVLGDSQLVPVNELKLIDLLMLKEAVEHELKGLSDKHNVPLA